MSIGVLVVALFFGGNNLTSDRSLTGLFSSPSAAAEEPAAAPPGPYDLLLRLLVERWTISAGGPMVQGSATRYGTQFNGLPLGCGGVYQSENATIVAVDPTHYADWACGTFMLICGSAGCVVGVRQDSCPGCAPGMVDLSEAGYAGTCGNAYPCAVTVQPLLISPPPPEQPTVPPAPAALGP